MTRPPGRRLEPIEAFEVTPWRALALFRVGMLLYAVALTAHNYVRYQHPSMTWVVIGVMAVWSALAITGYERPSARAWPLVAMDFGVTAACLLATRWVVGAELLADGTPTLTITWMACPVLAAAVVLGPRWAVAAAFGMGACDLAVRGVINQATVTGTVIMVVAASALGYLAKIAIRAQEALRMAAALEAAHAERDRLARGIHDSVLQVLALVQRRGEELGGEAAELGRLAGEQEVALRALVASEGQSSASGLIDLRGALAGLAGTDISLASPATAVWLPSRQADELTAAVAAALENVRRHCPPGTQVWILVEDEPDAVTVTIRDDGPGIPAGRLDQAAAQGRLGVAQSIKGRLRDLGGMATITSGPGMGTEIELRLGHTRAARARASLA